MSDAGHWFDAVIRFLAHLGECCVARSTGSSKDNVRYVDALERIAPGSSGKVDHDGAHRIARNVGNLPIEAFHFARIVRDENGELEIDSAQHRSGER